MGLSAEQINLRRPYITASEIGAVCGLNPYAGPYDVWLAKTGRAEPREATLEMDLGSALQEPIMRVASKHLNIKMRNNDFDCLFVHPDLPHCAATPDGDAEPNRGVEVKVVGPHTARNWDRDDDGIPGYVMAQVQWQMACCQTDETIVLALIWSALRNYRIERDDSLFSAMYRVAEKFWRDHIETDVPPAGAPEPLVITPQKNSLILDLDPISDLDTINTVSKYVSIQKTKNEIEKTESAHKKALREAIGENLGVRYGTYTITNKADKNGKRSLRWREEK